MDSSGRRRLEGFRIRLLLARQWIHVYCQFTEALGFSCCFMPRSSSTTVVWLVLLGSNDLERLCWHLACWCSRLVCRAGPRFSGI